ncbi:MAG TPA: alkaline phosphatase family protein [Stellaceae bacterium]|nr:alkaline phosphatase family protein [Stellaceae bacterium]
MTRANGRCPPLLVLALDGGDGALLQRWAAEGHLPNLAALMRRGCWGEIAGSDFIVDHGIFVSLWSGIPRTRHGYVHFRQLERGTYNLRGVPGRDFDAPPFWTRLRGTGKRVAVIDAPETYPVAGLEGIQLCDWCVHEPRHEPSANAEWLLREARKAFGAPFALDQRPNNSVRQDNRLFRKYIDRIRRKGRLLRHLLAHGEFDLVVAGFGETHTGGHQFWDYRDKPGEEVGALGHAIRDIYAAIDDEFGRILEQLGGEAVNVFLFGSMGIADSYPTNCILEAMLRKFGYLRDRPGAGGARPVDMARRLIPESWRVALGYWMPKSAQETLISDRFLTCTDWGGTQAYCLPAIHNSLVRINLRGREPHGIVEPGAEYETVLGRLEADLLGLVDAVDGLPVVRRVTRSRDIPEATAAADLPDLFIDWRLLPRFIDRVLYPGGELAITAPNWFRSSYHTDRGWYAAAGPSVAELGRSNDLSAVQLAPLLLSLIENPPGEAGPLLPAAEARGAGG